MAIESEEPHQIIVREVRVLEESTQPKPFSFLRFGRRACRRLGIWAFALIIAFFVPGRACGFPLPLSIWEHDVVIKHRFTDTFMAVVAMVVLSGSNIVDNILADKNDKKSGAYNYVGWLLVAGYILFLLFGMSYYGAGEENPGSSTWSVFQAMLLLGVAAEILIALSGD